MNPITLTDLRRVWSAFIDDCTALKEVVEHTLEPEPIPRPVKRTSPEPWPDPPPPKAPVLSCLVQGIIKSIQSEPDTWTRNEGHGWYTGIRQESSKTDLTTFINLFGAERDRVQQPTLTIAGYRVKLTHDEELALKPVIDARTKVIDDAERLRREQRNREEAARAVADAEPIIARFSTLGCSTPSTPSS